jgi:hypothetical protein
VGAGTGVLRFFALAQRAPQRLRSLYARGIDALRRHGGGSVARLGLSALDRRVRGAKRIVLFGLSSPLPMPEAEEAARHHTFRFATLDEIRARQGDGSGLWLPEDIEAAQRGDRCLLQLDGASLVGYTWIACNPMAFVTEGLHLNLADDVAYVYRAYTSPRYRGFGYQGLRTQELLRQVQPLGKRRLLCYVEWINFESLKGVAKSGYQKVGEVVFTRRGGIVRVRLSLASEFWSDARRTY